MYSPREGRVSAFDEAVGLGTVTDTQGETYDFHCTQIVDGTRAIAAGTPVTYRIVAGHRGRWEASSLRSDSWVCPVCATVNEGSPRSFEICRRCQWEDDPSQYVDAALAGGANRDSLGAARTAWSAPPMSSRSGS